jgi:methyl-accepting chemotaxis protein
MDKLSRIMFDRIAEIKFLSQPENNIMTSSNYSVQQKVEYLRNIERIYKYSDSMSIYDKNGIRIGDTRNFDIGINEQNMPFYKNATEHGIYYDKVPVFVNSLREYVIHFSAPLIDENGDINGVLVSRFPLNKINDILDEAEGTISKSAKVDLLSNEGDVIYSNYGRNLLLKKTPELAIFNEMKDSDNFIENVIANGSDNKKSIFVGAKERDFLDYKGNNWFLIFSVGIDELFNEIETLRNISLIIAIAILSVAMVFVFLFARTISKPIIKLKDAANQISKGNYNVDIKPTGTDEVGILSSQFDKMRHSIISSNKKLNELIAERTRRLQSTTEELEDVKGYLKMVIEEVQHIRKGKPDNIEDTEEKNNTTP